MAHDSNTGVRLRFAPAPTGLMHLGNVRAALMNYLYARQHKGTFIVRIEDTDAERNYDVGAVQIMQDLAWLGLVCDEGPGSDTQYAPYFQSERTQLYREKLDELIEQGHVYRCFCSPELLETKRSRQIALKQPPRYDRICLTLSESVIADHLNAQTPFIWRIKLPTHGEITITDIVRGTVHFDLKHFSDTPLTRQDGSFTFLFANFVDDMMMRITHIFRGEDHITNTATQSIMFKAFHAAQPVYWHMPIMCNVDGRKLSKRDFGFSLTDLRNAGYLPEAICNYLALIGGSFSSEVVPLQELVHKVDFSHIGKSSQIKYDVEQLLHLNHAWIKRLSPHELAQRCLPFLQARYGTYTSVHPEVVEGPLSLLENKELLESLITTVQPDLKTLVDSVQVLKFCFEDPTLTRDSFEAVITKDFLPALVTLFKEALSNYSDAQAFVAAIKEQAKAQNIPLKFVFAFVRIAITGSAHGPALHDLIGMVGFEGAKKRISAAIAVA